MQLRELHQNVGHLVAALAAADVDDDVDVGPLRQLMLHDGLARAEGAGDGGGAALGQREHGVDDALAGHERLRGRELPVIRPGHAHGPLLHEGEVFLALRRFQHADGFGDRERAGLDLLDGTGHVGRDHDLVQNGARLLHGADDVAAGELVARLNGGDEVPLLFPVQRRDLYAAGDGLAAEFADLGQRTLDAVIDALQHARAKLHGKGHAGRRDLGAGAEAARFFIDLNGGGAARHIQDLTDQLLFADADDVRHIGVFHPLGNDQRTGYLYNST